MNDQNHPPLGVAVDRDVGRAAPMRAWKIYVRGWGDARKSPPVALTG